MSEVIGKFFGHYSVFSQKKDMVYSIFRILTSLLFLQYGAQKLFGVLGGEFGTGHGVPLLGLLGLAGVIEFFGGLFMALGIFTRLAALFSTVEMLVAYLMAHFPKGFSPILNGGTLALMFFASFLLVLWQGSGRWGLEKIITGKEVF